MSRDQSQPTGVDRREVAWTLLLMLVGAGIAGCPTYENSYSGTYRESSPDPAGGQTGRRSVELDLFRYGDRAKAIMRYYKPDIVDGDPYGQQTFCTWTWADRFDEEAEEFELTVRRSSTVPSGRLVGEMLGKDRLEAALYDTDAGERAWGDIELERTEREPDTNCAGPQEFLVRPTFNLPGGTNRLSEPTDYDIENPVLAVQWVGIQRQEVGGSDPMYVAVREQGWSGRLGARHFEADQNAFDGDLSILVSPPPDKILSSVPGMQTQFAVGHLVVVDDSQEEGSFVWDAREEPIVASALQSGTLPGTPARANGSGKALLYVDGSVQGLAEGLGSTSGATSDSEPQPRLTGHETADDVELADQNLFIADVAVDFREDVVVQLEIYPQVTSPRVPLQATDRYLGEEFSSLPRLFP